MRAQDKLRPDSKMVLRSASIWNFQNINNHQVSLQMQVSVRHGHVWEKGASLFQNEQQNACGKPVQPETGLGDTNTYKKDV